MDRAALSQQMKATWSQLRRRPIALSASCGCSGGFGGLTTRDFEESLVFHLRERWREGPAGAALATFDTVDDIIDWAGAAADPQSADTRLDILQDMKRSIDSFAFTCAAHRFRAEAV